MTIETELQAFFSQQVTRAQFNKMVVDGVRSVFGASIIDVASRIGRVIDWPDGTSQQDRRIELPEDTQIFTSHEPGVGLVAFYKKNNRLGEIQIVAGQLDSDGVNPAVLTHAVDLTNSLLLEENNPLFQDGKTTIGIKKGGTKLSTTRTMSPAFLHPIVLLKGQNMNAPDFDDAMLKAESKIAAVSGTTGFGEAKVTLHKVNDVLTSISIVFETGQNKNTVQSLPFRLFPTRPITSQANSVDISDDGGKLAMVLPVATDVPVVNETPIEATKVPEVNMSIKDWQKLLSEIKLKGSNGITMDIWERLVDKTTLITDPNTIKEFDQLGAIVILHKNGLIQVSASADECADAMRKGNFVMASDMRDRPTAAYAGILCFAASELFKRDRSSQIRVTFGKTGDDRHVDNPSDVEISSNIYLEKEKSTGRYISPVVAMPPHFGIRTEQDGQLLPPVPPETFGVVPDTKYWMDSVIQIPNVRYISIYGN